MQPASKDGSPIHPKTFRKLQLIGATFERHGYVERGRRPNLFVRDYGVVKFYAISAGRRRSRRGRTSVHSSIGSGIRSLARLSSSVSGSSCASGSASARCRGACRMTSPTTRQRPEKKRSS